MTPTEELLSDPAEGSAAPGPSAPNLVTIDCTCIGHPHDTDTVTLAPEVPLELGMAAAAVISTGLDAAVMIGRLSGLYIRYAPIAWTLVDAKGKPEELTPDNAYRRLPYNGGGYEVAERASALYFDALMRPLQAARAKPSQVLPLDRLTSQKNGTGPKRRPRSRPSSPTSTAGRPSAVPVP